MSNFVFYQDNEILNGNNFAIKSDLIFSEIIEKKKLSIIKSQFDIEIIDENNEHIFYRRKNFTISSNQLIFTNTMSVELLFSYLKKLKNIENLKIITHQTDIPINKKLFSKKSKNVSAWFSPNIAYNHPQLFALPLGIANDFSTKNLTYKHFDNFNNNLKKEEKMYINFVINTNFSKRKDLYDKFSNKNWVSLDKPNLTLKQYRNKLIQHKYILCPPGNGIDTHRLWETLYLGSIPVVEENQFNNYYKNLPIITYKNLEELSLESLNSKFKNLNFDNINLLKTSTWINQIKEKSIHKEHNDVIFFQTSSSKNNFYDKKNNLLRMKEKYFKRLKHINHKLFKLKKKIF